MSEKERKSRQVRFDEIKHTMQKLEGLIEVVALTLVYYFIWRNCYDIPSMHRYAGNGKYLLMAVYGILTIVLFTYCEGFKYGFLKLSDVSISQWISLLIVNTVTYFQLCLIANRMITVLPMLLLTGIDIVISFALSYVFTAIYHRLYIPKRMIMVYGTENSLSLKMKMESRNDKYRIMQTISCSEYSYDEIISEIARYDAVVINDVDAKIRNDLLKYCYRNSIRTYLVPKLSDIIYSGGDDITLFDTPLKLVKGRGLTPAQRFTKRAFDLILCTIAIIPVLIATLFISIAIKIEDGGAIFYKQKRVTRGGKTFEILKFRSMIENAESDGKPHPATENDNRITKVGKVIRAMRLDELPQIFNIIKGDMSIVGPRPERVEHCEQYSEKIPEFEFRNKVKGGLTGYAQIYGKYNTSALDKLRLDLMYIENYSLILDIKLILMTIRIMFKKESTEGFKAVQENSAEESVEITNEISESSIIG